MSGPSAVEEPGGDEDVVEAGFELGGGGGHGETVLVALEKAEAPAHVLDADRVGVEEHRTVEVEQLVVQLAGAVEVVGVDGPPEGADPARIDVSYQVEGRDVIVSVRDNGHGIPIHEHKRIFQKFYRLDDRLSRQREGSGLGLAIVKHVMRAHRGRVELVSDPGKGSVFSLVVPAATSRSSEPARAHESVAPTSLS